MKQTLRTTVARELPFFMSVPAIVWQLLFFYIPLGIIIALSFLQHAPTGPTGQAGVWPGLTFGHYRELIAVPFMRIIARSLGLALITAFACLVFAYPVAYFLARKIKRAKNLLLFLLMLPFWTNFLIQLYAWFFLLERNGIINTFLLKLHIISVPLSLTNNLFAVFLVMFYCYLPFMIMPLYSTLEKLDPALFEASFDLGANPWQTFLTVTMPLSRSGMKTGFFLVFVPAFSEFVIPALLGGDKYMFVGTLITHYFLVARDLFLGSAFTCLSGLVLLMIALLVYWYFNNDDR